MLYEDHESLFEVLLIAMNKLVPGAIDDLTPDQLEHGVDCPVNRARLDTFLSILSVEFSCASATADVPRATGSPCPRIG